MNVSQLVMDDAKFGEALQRVAKMFDGMGFQYADFEDVEPDMRVTLEITNGKRGLAYRSRIFALTFDGRGYVIQKDGYEEHRFVTVKRAPNAWLEMLQYGP